MRHRGSTMAASIAIALLVGTWSVRSADAQAPGFKRVELQRHDLGTPGREGVTVRADFEPHASVPKHTHPGEEFGYVMKGELLLEVEGKPPMRLKAGDAFFVPAGQVHSGKSEGRGGATVLSTYVIEKGKPLATPVK